MQAIPPALKRAVEAAVIGAWILPEEVIGFAWFAFLDYDNGTLNMILTALGLPRGAIPVAPRLLGRCRHPRGAVRSAADLVHLCAVQRPGRARPRHPQPVHAL